MKIIDWGFCYNVVWAKFSPGHFLTSEKHWRGTVIKDCVAQVREQMPGVRIEIRMDAAFFQEEILHYLDRENIQFAVKVPMWKWLKLKETINARQRWHHAGKKLS